MKAFRGRWLGFNRRRWRGRGRGRGCSSAAAFHGTEAESFAKELDLSDDL